MHAFNWKKNQNTNTDLSVKWITGDFIFHSHLKFFLFLIYFYCYKNT